MYVKYVLLKYELKSQNHVIFTFFNKCYIILDQDQLPKLLPSYTGNIILIQTNQEPASATLTPLWTERSSPTRIYIIINSIYHFKGGKSRQKTIRERSPEAFASKKVKNARKKIDHFCWSHSWSLSLLLKPFMELSSPASFSFFVTLSFFFIEIEEEDKLFSSTDGNFRRGRKKVDFDRIEIWSRQSRYRSFLTPSLAHLVETDRTRAWD